MDSIVNRLTEIEDAASAIVQYAEDQKEELNKEYDEKRKKFDAELEEKTQARIRSIRESFNILKQNLSRIHPGFSTARMVRVTRRLRLFRRNTTSGTQNMPARF